MYSVSFRYNPNTANPYWVYKKVNMNSLDSQLDLSLILQ